MSNEILKKKLLSEYIKRNPLVIEKNKQNRSHKLSERLSGYNDIISGKYYCMKCNYGIFDNIEISKKILREIYIQRTINNPYILKISDILLPGNIYSFNTLCYTTEKIDSDLRDIRLKKIRLKLDDIQYIMYQILSGVNALHKNKIIHRNIQPESIYIKKNFDVRIGEYSTAIINDEDIGIDKSPSTNWYRAPEVLLDNQFSYSSDIWSVGCILYELLTRTILFREYNTSQQIESIASVIGQPPKFSWIDKKLMSNLKKYEENSIKWPCQFPESFSLVIDLLEHLLTWDPEKRFTAEDALKHPFIQPAFEKHPVRRKPFSLRKLSSPTSVTFQNSDIYSDRYLNKEEIKEKIVEEIRFYHPFLKLN